MIDFLLNTIEIVGHNKHYLNISGVYISRRESSRYVEDNFQSRGSIVRGGRASLAVRLQLATEAAVGFKVDLRSRCDVYQ